MKLMLAVLITLLVALQYKLWIDDDGIREVLRLTTEVDDLKSGLGAIEERARTDLGMIREGETFYHLIGEESTGGSRILRHGNGAGAQ